MTLGGNICTRNCNTLGYCWREAINSLLPVCDVVSICDAESEDGTQEEIREWCKVEPKLSLCVWPWPNPKGQPEWYANWINYGREHVAADWQFQLDADEVLHENSYGEIRKFIEGPQDRVGIVTRFNFWKDHQHLIPDGHCCAKRVIRLAPQKLWLASDGYDPRGERTAALGVSTAIQIAHYGFIRSPSDFFRKEKLLQGYYFDSYDPRLEKAEKVEGNWMTMEGVTGWEDKLDTFTGSHPQQIHQWLKERGYDAI